METYLISPLVKLKFRTWCLPARPTKTIAAELYICEKTVEFHHDRICTKIGARKQLMLGI